MFVLIGVLLRTSRNAGARGCPGVREGRPLGGGIVEVVCGCVEQAVDGRTGQGHKLSEGLRHAVVAVGCAPEPTALLGQQMCNTHLESNLKQKKLKKINKGYRMNKG